MSHKANLTLGELVKSLRNQRDWTVREMLDRIERRSGKKVSPAYITRVEQYGDIPSPDFLCELAETLGCRIELLLDAAKNQKLEQTKETLEAKYSKALGHYRTTKSQRRGD